MQLNAKAVLPYAFAADQAFQWRNAVVQHMRLEKPRPTAITPTLGYTISELSRGLMGSSVSRAKSRIVAISNAVRPRTSESNSWIFSSASVVLAPVAPMKGVEAIGCDPKLRSHVCAGGHRFLGRFLRGLSKSGIEPPAVPKISANPRWVPRMVYLWLTMSRSGTVAGSQNIKPIRNGLGKIWEDFPWESAYVDALDCDRWRSRGRL
jgi:hypothetical protein